MRSKTRPAWLVLSALLAGAGFACGWYARGTHLPDMTATGRDEAPVSVAFVPAEPGLSVAPPRAGAYAAQVLRVIDGDTIDARVEIWLGQTLDVKVRLRGIDTPELNGRCTAESRDAAAARESLAALAGARVTLTDIGPDKYFGRVIARALSDDGRDLGAALLSAGRARPYQGRKRTSWCESASAG